MKKYYFYQFLFLLIASFIFSNNLFAADINRPTLQVNIPTVNFSDKVCTGAEGEQNCSIPWLGEYITGIYKYSMGLILLLAVVVMMFGGIMWILAAGDTGRITTAKGLINGSLTGLVIALSSYLILFQINPNLTVFAPLKIGVVKEVKFSNEFINSTEYTAGDGSDAVGKSNHTVGDWSNSINTYSKEYGVNPNFIKAMMMIESNGKEDATSPKGAMGLMQIMPKTAKEMGATNPYDPDQNILAGVKYISGLLKRYNNDPAMALAAYNWGMGNLDKKGLNNAPTETKNYINKVITNFNKNSS